MRRVINVDTATHNQIAYCADLCGQTMSKFVETLVKKHIVAEGLTEAPRARLPLERGGICNCSPELFCDRRYTRCPNCRGPLTTPGN